jgi:hypothetical protein
MTIRKTGGVNLSAYFLGKKAKAHVLIYTVARAIKVPINPPSVFKIKSSI